MFKKQKIERQDERKTYLDVVGKAQENGRNLEEQLKYLEVCQAAPQDKMLAIITLIQQEYAIYIVNHSGKVEIPVKSMEYFLRGLLDMARHMQSNLPDGVYDYILNNSESFYNIVAEKTYEK